MTDEDTSLLIPVARAVEQHPIAPYYPIQRQTWSITISQKTLQDPCCLHTEAILASPHQAHWCSPSSWLCHIIPEVSHHCQPGPATPLYSRRRKAETPSVWIQESGVQGNGDQGHPCSTRCSWQQSSHCVSSGTASPGLCIAGGGVSWAQSDCTELALSPKQPALLGLAQQHLGWVHAGPPKYLGLALPTIHILHTFIFPALRGPGQQRTSLFPTRTFKLACGPRSEFGTWTLQTNIYIAAPPTSNCWVIVNQKRFATSTNGEQQLQMFSMHALMGQRYRWSPVPQSLSLLP